ncbi:pentatricopeptide repeat-containing protein [Hibiscus syriacus]|uniref:Pentatricopeptide repeat-containing protein n=1 Tax=Hibiscus syriacus TaxID=106335 RepID=A0A6A2ZUF3_HIBSY|nr:pentatricopeptide repeat-containing protein [Hibiscus syriacus]
MDHRRLSRDSSLQKKALENRHKVEENQQHVPDLTDFINDMFFGTVNDDKKAFYNLTGNAGGGGKLMDEDDEDFDSSTRSNSSKLTEEWLEEARHMVASSPRCGSPSSLNGSPRFAAVQTGRLSLSSSFERRDPLSRSARRHRQLEGISGEILSKSAKHSRYKSETQNTDNSPAADISAAETVHKCFSNILKPTNHTLPSSGPPSPTAGHDVTGPPATTLPPRQSTFRRSRFQADPSAQAIPSFRSTLKTQPPLEDTKILSPPKNLFESSQRRSISSSTCSFQPNKPLSPPRNLVESAQRRSISKSTCYLEKIQPNGWSREDDGSPEISLNGFLKDQRAKFEMILNGEVDSKAKIILSGPSNSTSSMVAAICYAWLLDKRTKKSRGDEVIVAVMNFRRERMWKQRQAAWLFHHVGLDATSLLFADEVDVESLMMAGQLSILLVGQDVLKTNGEVGCQCTLLTDNYCEDAYELLQTPMLKKLLLAGILLDTQNLNVYAKLSTARDAEAIQLLLVGLAPNYRYALFDQLMQDGRDSSFVEALEHNYGKPPNDGDGDNRLGAENTPSNSRIEASATNSDKHSNHARIPKVNKSARPAKPGESPAKPAPEASRGKSKFFLAKWFGFGSK